MKSNSKPKFDYKKPRTLRDARKANRQSAKKYRDVMLDVVGKRKLSPKMRKVFLAVLGQIPYPGPLRASDIEAKAELGKQMVQHIAAHRKQNPGQRLFFFTGVSDEFRVDKAKPILWLKKLRFKADKALRLLCKKHGMVGAIGVIEAVLILNPPDARVPEYSFHVHVLCWADPDFNFEAAKTEIESLRSWTNSWGMPPIKFDEITDKMGHPAWWAHYMTEQPYDAKNVIELDNGSVRLRSTVKGYRPNARLRLMEGLSQCLLADTVFGVSDGKFIRDPVLRRTKQARALAHPGIKPVKIDRLKSMFKAFWSTSRANHKKSWFIID